ncbi:MAG: biotin--[acetyl-CoA-carboxylase] ligase [Spirochaetales bacterium]|nr:biotin--[acetyl-CoA-carboxylase] ligase [Spirochaetales bacterium]
MRALDLHNPWEGAPIFYVESTRSTMDEASSLGRRGYPGGTTVVTDHQAAGRGRLEGRRWSSEAGMNLLFTVLLREQGPRPEHFRLPLLVGLAVSRTLEAAFGLEPTIKWPNDVLCRLPARQPAQQPAPAASARPSGRHGKVAGILCEALSLGEALLLLAGVGINCNQLAFPGQPGAVSLAGLLGRPIDRLYLLEAFLAQLHATLADPGWKAALLARLHLLGREVTVRQGLPDAGSDRRVSGTLAGLEEDGALRLQLPGGGSCVVHSGELAPGPG